MIQARTGEFKLDDYKLVIHPDLTLSQFKAGDIPLLKASSPDKMGFASCWFNGSIDGLEAEVKGLLKRQADVHSLQATTNRKAV